MSQEILQQCTVEGFVVKLPEIKIDRKIYLDVKNALELIGGKWKGNKVQGFVFEEDPTEMLAELASGEKRNLKKEFQFFPTPLELASKMVANCFTTGVIVKPGTKILEPSAGDGALINAIHRRQGGLMVDCFELMELNRMKLKKVYHTNIIGEDFLQCELDGIYDYIIANPPFTKNQDIIHIGKMYQCLKIGGTMVALASPSFTWSEQEQKLRYDFKMFLRLINAEIEEIEAGSFKESGTMVATVMITIRDKSSFPLPLSIQEKLKTVKQSVQLPPENIFIPLNDDLAKQAVDSGFVENRKKETANHPCAKCGREVENFSKMLPNDLCYQCMPEPEEILKSMFENQKEIDKNLLELQKMLSPNNQNDMNFFEQLAATGNVDMSIRILQKGDKLTLNITPASMGATIQPIIITGTAAELDEGFFASVFPSVVQIAGIASNLSEVEKELQKKVADSKAKSTATPEKKEVKPAEKKIEAPKPVEKKVEALKPVVVKKEAPVFHDMFGEDENEAEESKVDSDTEQANEDE